MLCLSKSKGDNSSAEAVEGEIRGVLESLGVWGARCGKRNEFNSLLARSDDDSQLRLGTAGGASFRTANSFD
jgi:hypothetical protein